MPSLEDQVHDALANLRIARALYEHTDIHTDPEVPRQMAHLDTLRQKVETLNAELNALLDQMRALRERT